MVTSLILLNTSLTIIYVYNIIIMTNSQQTDALNMFVVKQISNFCLKSNALIKIGGIFDEKYKG
ncbi:hypothetical protein JCM11672_24760 [Alkaliphilus crotonatoxidans]